MLTEGTAVSCQEQVHKLWIQRNYMLLQVVFDTSTIHFFLSFSLLAIPIKEYGEPGELLEPPGRPRLPFGHSQINQLVLYLV